LEKGAFITVRSDRGTTLLEMLVALNLLMGLCMVVFPQIIIVLREREHVKQHYYAYAALRNEVSAHYQNVSMIQEKQYRIFWDDKQKVCVKWGDLQARERKICTYVSQR
jgi:type II secretory pathway component PulJ